MAASAAPYSHTLAIMPTLRTGLKISIIAAREGFQGRCDVRVHLAGYPGWPTFCWYLPSGAAQVSEIALPSYDDPAAQFFGQIAPQPRLVAAPISLNQTSPKAILNFTCRIQIARFCFTNPLKLIPSQQRKDRSDFGACVYLITSCLRPTQRQ